MNRKPAPQRQQGLGLIDLVCAWAVCAVLLGGAWPSVRSLWLNQGLRNVADTLRSDVHYARSLSLTDARSVRLSILALPDGGSCAVVHSGGATACQCVGNGLATCKGDAVPFRVSEHPARGAAQLASVGRSLVFDGGKGTISPTATLVVTDRQGRSVRQIVNIMGRVRACTPDAVQGFPACAA